MAGVAVITGVLTAFLAFALGLLAESLVGGVVLALVVVFVLDGVLSFVSAIKDYTLAAALGSMSSAADPTKASEIGFWGGHRRRGRLGGRPARARGHPLPTTDFK